MSQRFIEQLRATQVALGSALASGPAPDNLGYAYQRGTVLVPAGSADGALATLNGTPRGERWWSGDQEVRAGLRRITLRDPRPLRSEQNPDPVGEDQDVLDALRILNTPFNTEYQAAPNHVVSITNVNMCPADEPVPTTEPPSLAPLAPSPVADGPLVLVVDTGLMPGSMEEFPHVGGNPRAPGTIGPDGFIREYADHGTFIAELLAGVAPRANVWVSNLLPDLGAAFDDEFGRRLVQALDTFEERNGRWPDIISLSAGSQVMDLTLPLPGHVPFMTGLAAHPDTILVAAAGNNGSDIPFWPAASSDVISVGALRENGEDRACFSDFGPWVKVYAPGERLVAGFLEGPLKYQHSTYHVCQFIRSDPYDCTCKSPAHVGELSDPGHGDVVEFAGRARWSGTSFATPLVAGMIADGMTRNGAVGPRTAAEEVLKHATHLTIEGASAPAVFPDNYQGRRPPSAV